MSGFFDGGYSAAMPAVERLTQVALVLGLTVLALLAGRPGAAAAARLTDPGHGFYWCRILYIRRKEGLP